MGGRRHETRLILGSTNRGLPGQPCGHVTVASYNFPVTVSNNKMKNNQLGASRILYFFADIYKGDLNGQ